MVVHGWLPECMCACCIGQRSASRLFDYFMWEDPPKSGPRLLVPGQVKAHGKGKLWVLFLFLFLPACLTLAVHLSQRQGMLTGVRTHFFKFLTKPKDRKLCRNPPSSSSGLGLWRHLAAQMALEKWPLLDYLSHSL